MKLSNGVSEQEFLETFNRVVNRLIFKFRFGSYESNDLFQEAFLLAVDGMKKYDTKRPLANFLYIHLRNRLYNFKRDNYIRLEVPCTRCPLNAFRPPDCCDAYVDKMDCSLYEGWINRNILKRNLNNALEYNQVGSINEPHMGYNENIIENINTKELLEIIDNELPFTLRKAYLRMLAGDKVNKKEREEIENFVLKTIKKHKIEI